MIHSLYSELRTLYETTPENPHTFRLSLKMKDMIKEPILREAVDLTMKRYPYFRVRLKVTPEGLKFEDNPAEVPLLHQDAPSVLGSSENGGHLLLFCWWKNIVHIDCHHALTDGGGIYPMIRTLLYYYCSLYYGKELSSEGIRLSDSPVKEAEWTDPALKPLAVDTSMLIEKREGPAFQLFESGLIKEKLERGICYNLRIREDEFMRFNLSHDGSPGTIIALFLARAIEKLRPAVQVPTVVAMCVNQRPALKAFDAHQSLVGDVRIVFGERFSKMPFMQQATAFRGAVALQSGADMVKQEIEEYREVMRSLEALPDDASRHRYCVDLMEKKTSAITATVSYVGKAPFGDAERYIQEFHVMPSTALPSSATPLTIELSAVNGSFYLNFLQYFREDIFLDAFLEELRENDIDYDVLYQTPMNYPEVGEDFRAFMG